MEHVAAFILARSADQRRMSAGRLDGPVEATRPSRWHRSGEAVRRARAALRNRRLFGAPATDRTPSATPAASTGRSARTGSRVAQAGPAGGCAPRATA